MGDPGEPVSALTFDRVREAIAAVLAPSHCVLGPGIGLETSTDCVEESWEIFHGRLLDATQTRQRRRLESWHVYLVDGAERSGAPVLAIKLDTEAGLVHVVRAIHCYVWEGYDQGDNVILSRETTRWVRELVASVPLAEVGEAASLRATLADCLFRAVVGCSRLPLTSLEAPLPAFTLGQMAYFYEPGGSAPAATLEQQVRRARGRPWLQQVKLLEMLLRSTPVAALPRLVFLFAELCRETSDRPPIAWLQTLFDEVSLSPWTDFGDRSLALLAGLVEGNHVSAAQAVDFCSWLLRHLGRHLTAYDLVTFHHQGANYPDALLLDAVLKTYLMMAQQYPELFAGPDDPRKRLRRRALRQGWLIRRVYEGHPVPAQPTSPGESQRVWPPPLERVPQEQIVMPHRRPRRLYDQDPLPAHAGPRAQEALAASLADLDQPAELRELGTALLLDRPLTMCQRPGEPDPTLLFSCVACSPTLAARRLDALARLGLLDDARCADLQQRLQATPLPPSLPVPRPRGPAVPGRVSLTDAFRVADDFRILHTTRRSVADFLEAYPDLTATAQVDTAFLTGDRPVFVVRDDMASPVVSVLDSKVMRRLEIELEPRAAGQLPALRVVRAWDEQGAAIAVNRHLIEPRRCRQW